MADEKRRALRYSLIASVEIIELHTDTHFQAQTSDVSLVGCYLDMLNPLPLATSVKLTITHEEATFTALGTVAHSEPNMGMGIGFKEVEAEQLKVLQKWIENLSREQS